MEIIKKILEKANIFVVLVVTIIYIVIRLGLGLVLGWKVDAVLDIAIGGIIISVVSTLATYVLDICKLRNFSNHTPLYFFTKYDKVNGYPPVYVHRKDKKTGQLFIVFKEEIDYLWLMPEIRFKIVPKAPKERVDIKKIIGDAIYDGDLAKLRDLTIGQHRSCDFIWADGLKPFKIKKDRTEESRDKKFFICEEMS